MAAPVIEVWVVLTNPGISDTYKAVHFRMREDQPMGMIMDHIAALPEKLRNPYASCAWAEGTTVRFFTVNSDFPWMSGAPSHVASRTYLKAHDTPDMMGWRTPVRVFVELYDKRKSVTHPAIPPTADSAQVTSLNRRMKDASPEIQVVHLLHLPRPGEQLPAEEDGLSPWDRDSIAQMALSEEQYTRVVGVTGMAYAAKALMDGEPFAPEVVQTTMGPDAAIRGPDGTTKSVAGQTRLALIYPYLSPMDALRYLDNQNEVKQQFRYLPRPTREQSVMTMKGVILQDLQATAAGRINMASGRTDYQLRRPDPVQTFDPNAAYRTLPAWRDAADADRAVPPGTSLNTMARPMPEFGALRRGFLLDETPKKKGRRTQQERREMRKESELRAAAEKKAAEAVAERARERYCPPRALMRKNTFDLTDSERQSVENKPSDEFLAKAKADSDALAPITMKLNDHISITTSPKARQPGGYAKPRVPAPTAKDLLDAIDAQVRVPPSSTPSSSGTSGSASASGLPSNAGSASQPAVEDWKRVAESFIMAGTRHAHMPGVTLPFSQTPLQKEAAVQFMAMAEEMTREGLLRRPASGTDIIQLYTQLLDQRHPLALKWKRITDDLDQRMSDYSQQEARARFGPPSA